MNKELLKTLFFLTCICFANSCAIDDDIGEAGGGNIEKSLFTIHAANLGSSGYLMATSSETGEVFYWNAMTNFTDNITFDTGEAETVDLTYATEFGSAFNITTYRDVESEFRFLGFINSCNEDQVLLDPLNLNSVDIIFPGTNEIVEFFNPGYDGAATQQAGNTMFDQEKKISYDFDNNITIVNILLGNTNLDPQFVFRFQGEQDYKSIIIKREDWVMAGDDNFQREVAIEDLQPCTKYEIDLGIENNWIVNADVLTTSGDRIEIARWTNFVQNQSGETISLFLQDDFEIDQLFLKVTRNVITTGFEIQKFFDEMPTSISLNEFTKEVSDLTPNTFNYSIGEDFDVAQTTYTYLNNNFRSSWNIYQKSSSTGDYTLPEIQSEFLDQTTVMMTLLSDPIDFRLQVYSFDTDVNQIFNESEIKKVIPCLNFDSSYDSFDF